MSATSERPNRGFRPRIKAVLGTTWAALALPIVLGTFFGMDTLGRKMATATGLRISPWYSGGDVVRGIDHPSYRTRIHEPVFGSLLGRRKVGCVQVDFLSGSAADSLAPLPDPITEEIDFDSDGSADFTLTVERAPGRGTGEGIGATTESYRATVETPGTTAGMVGATGRRPRVLGIESTIRLDKGFAVRVKLER